MGPVGPGRIVRPLLELGREEILAYLDALGASYVDDSSNLSPTMLRNRVRHQLIPTLERDYAPRLSRRLFALAREMRTLDDYITGEGRRELHRRLLTPDRLDLAGFAQLHPALSSSIIREWMRERLGDLRRIYRTDIERVGRFCTIAAPGSTLRLARGWRLRCEYGSVVFEPIPASSAAPFAVELRRDGRTEIAAAGFSFEARLLDSRSPDSRSILGKAGLPQMEALIDADQIDGELIVRSFRRGDHIQLFGMTGTRKVHDVMVDRKLPRDRRASWPIVEAEREILWIPGMVRSRLALVSEATERLLHLIAKPRANPENTSLLRN
jgi:tRNA(Ile)-lysidine synthase